MQTLRSEMYTIKTGNKTFSVTHDGRYYVVGFANLRMARKIQLNLHPTPYVNLRRDSTKSIEMIDMNITLDTDSMITIQKFRGSSADPLNDGNYYISTHQEHEFLLYPIDKMIGIIMPYDVVKEDDDEFVLRSHIVDPLFNADYYKSSLNKMM